MPAASPSLLHDPTVMLTRSRALVAQTDRLLAATARLVESGRELVQAEFSRAPALAASMSLEAAEAPRDTSPVQTGEVP